MILLAFVLTVIVTDWRWRRIPNVVTYPTIVAGLGLSALAGLGGLGGEGLIDHVAAVVLAFLVCYPFYAAGGLKAGDAKLLMSVAALRVTGFFLGAAFYGAMLGGVVALGFIVVRKLSKPGPGDPPNTLRRILGMWIPYGVALGGGVLVALAVDLTRA
ncbi:hypothetical protein BH18ACT12_BH18ACT12_17000 [soil metagenome]